MANCGIELVSLKSTRPYCVDVFGNIVGMRIGQRILCASAGASWTRSSNVRLLHHATARNIGVNVSATRVENLF